MIAQSRRRNVFERLLRFAWIRPELVDLKLNVIVSGAAAATRSLKRVTNSIPIVWRRIAILLETDLSRAY